MTCMQISQDGGQVICYSHLLKSFPQFVVIHTVKGFDIVNKSEVDVFLEFSCFFDDLWFLCLLLIQLEHPEVHSSHTVEA